MFSSSLMAFEGPGTASSPSDVNWFSDMVVRRSGNGQARPRFRSYRVDLFSCRLY